MTERVQWCDVLVIGGGGAGNMAAIYAARQGAEVILLEKGVYGQAGCTILGSYSVNAAFGYIDSRDNPSVHAADTLREGRNVNDRRLVNLFAQEAPQRVDELVRFGVRFNIQGNHLAQSLLEGSTYPRSCFADFKTGRMMMGGMRRELRQYENISIYDGVIATRLLQRSGRVFGAEGIQLHDSQPCRYISGATVMATGGAGQLYAHNTTSVDNTGDGMVLALDAGASLRDLEFVQFLPLTLCYPRLFGMIPGVPTMLPKLVDARLTNELGEDFAERATPDWRHRATRDILSQLMYKEIMAGRAGPHGGLYLSVAHNPPDEIERVFAFDHLFDRLMQQGVDLRRDSLEVEPAAHYHIGGISIGEHCQTDVAGLYAAGEVTGGIHGANRLAGNALSEILVFGARAGSAAADYAVRNRPSVAEISGVPCSSPSKWPVRGEGLRPAAVKSRLQQIMWKDCGIIRDQSHLEQASRSLLELKSDVESSIRICSPVTVYNREILDLLEAEKMLVLAQAVVEAARMRTESRGAHYRADYPETDEVNWRANLFVRKNGTSLGFECRPIKDIQEHEVLD